MATKTADLRALDKLPDSALISIPELAAITACGISTTWRRLASDPHYPKVVKLGERCTRVRLGDVRALIAAKQEA